jgi:hypothetical protein
MLETKKPESVGCRAKLERMCWHALAVFVRRPQADIKSAQCRKNSEVVACRQTGMALLASRRPSLLEA